MSTLLCSSAAERQQRPPMRAYTMPFATHPILPVHALQQGEFNGHGSPPTSCAAIQQQKLSVATWQWANHAFRGSQKRAAVSQACSLGSCTAGSRLIIWRACRLQQRTDNLHGVLVSRLNAAVRSLAKLVLAQHHPVWDLDWPCIGHNDDTILLLSHDVWPSTSVWRSDAIRVRVAIHMRAAIRQARPALDPSLFGGQDSGVMLRCPVWLSDIDRVYSAVYARVVVRHDCPVVEHPARQPRPPSWTRMEAERNSISIGSYSAEGGHSEKDVNGRVHLPCDCRCTTARQPRHVARKAEKRATMSITGSPGAAKPKRGCCGWMPQPYAGRVPGTRATRKDWLDWLHRSKRTRSSLRKQ